MFDVAIIGAGPVGLACAIEAKKKGLSYTVLEKGLLTNSIYHFPSEMTFFSTADLLEIGDVPFIITEPKPKRVDALKYYWRVTLYHNLSVKLGCQVNAIAEKEDGFALETSSGEVMARKIIIATGFYDNPNYLSVPGENLPHVSHFYSDPHQYAMKKVAVIGANNSAVEAALELFRYGVDVTLIHRGPGLGKGVKAWVLPDIQNRLTKGEIEAIFDATVSKIESSELTLETPTGPSKIVADAVLALTGYHPDFDFMRSAGIAINETTSMPDFDTNTGETNVPGLYIAGALQAGRDANKIFIENGRLHAPVILDDIARKLKNVPSLAE